MNSIAPSAARRFSAVSAVHGLRARWSGEAGYHEVLQRAVPLIISTGSFSVQHFINRIFLSHHSQVSLAASMPAGMTSYTLVCFFIGTASYATTFVAQYFGAGEKRRVGAAVWQAIYFAALAGVVLPLAAPLAEAVFGFAGHAPEVRREECLYFKIVMVWGFFPIFSNAVSSFFTGLGRNWVVMAVNIFATTLNILFDYVLIFGRCGFPEMGIRGAAWASNIAAAAAALAFAALMFTRANERDFAVFSAWRFDRALFARLLRFGAPSGAHFMLDLLSFTLFMLVVGRIGTSELSATNIAFNINSIAFMPMLGFGIAVSTLVGQRLGENNPALAEKSVWSAFHLAFAYMAAISLLYVAFPGTFLAPFVPSLDATAFAPIYQITKNLLYFVAAYCMLDTLNIIFAGALKGAGDTRYVMVVSVAMAWGIMVIPTWLACTYFGQGIYAAWIFLSAFVMTLGFGFLVRFLRGKWKEMRVIECPAPVIPTSDEPSPCEEARF